MKHCPHCKGTQFKAIIKRPGALQITEEGVTIIKEVDRYVYEIVECLACKNKVTEADLVEDLHACDNCKEPVQKTDVIEGLCPVCHAMKTRPDLASATPEELIKRLLAFEKASVTGATKIEQKLQASSATETVVEQKQAAAQIKAEEKATANPVVDEEALKRSEAAKRAAETRKANAEKKKAEEAQALAQAQAQPVAVEQVEEIVVTQTPAPSENVPANNNIDLPMGEEVNFDDLTPPAFGMEDPF